MKLTLKEIIDKFDESFVDNDTEIQEDMELDIDSITKNVLTAIHSEDNAPDINQTVEKPKKKRKNLFILISAAVISTAVIGTTVLAATGVFNPFSTKFNGDADTLKVYSNDSFRFDSEDDNLQAKFTGFVGDEDFTLAAVELTKNDGSTFINEDGVLSGQSELALSGYSYKVDSDYIKENGYATELPEYYLSPDKKTLTLFLTIETPFENVKGTTVQFESEKLYAYSLTDKISESNVVTSSFVTESVVDDNVLQTYENDKYVEYSIKTIPYDLPYRIYLELDEKPEVFMKKELTSENAPHLIRYENTVDMTLSPFKLKLTQDKKYSDAQIKAVQDIPIEEDMTVDYCFSRSLLPFREDAEQSYENYINTMNSGILMMDGKQYYFAQKDCSADIKKSAENTAEWNVHSSMELMFTEYPLDPIMVNYYFDSLSAVVVDPSKIAVIVINGDIVYAAPDCEDMRLKEPMMLSHSWIPSEIRDIIFETDLEIESISFSSAEINETYNCSETEIVFEALGKSEDILKAVRRVERERERGLFIKSVTLSSDQDESYHIGISLTNPHIIADNNTYKEATEKILKEFGKYSWSSICEEYFTKRNLPSSEVPFYVTENGFMSFTDPAE